MSIKKICDYCEVHVPPDKRNGWIVVSNGDLFDLHFCDWTCLYQYAEDLAETDDPPDPQLPLGVSNAHV